MITLLISLLILFAVVIAAFYISTYLYEKDLTLMAFGVILIAIVASIIIVGVMVDSMVDFISQKLEIFYNKDS